MKKSLAVISVALAAVIGVGCNRENPDAVREQKAAERKEQTRQKNEKRWAAERQAKEKKEADRLKQATEEYHRKFLAAAPLIRLDLNEEGIISTVKVIQIFGPDRFLADLSGTSVMLVGVPTAGLVDGKGVAFSSYFKVTGTTSYPATNGPRTVYLITPWALPPLPLELHPKPETDPEPKTRESNKPVV